MKKLFIVGIIIFILGFWSGKLYTNFFYIDVCLDLGGGQMPGNYPICVIEKYNV